MKRNKAYRMQKRTTFPRLFLKAVCVSLICTVIFACIFTGIYENSIGNQISDCMTDSAMKISRRLAQNSAKSVPVGDISGYMGMYTRYDVMYDNLPDFMYQNSALYRLNSDFGNPDNFAMSAITNSDGNMIASSRKKLSAIFTFGVDDNNNGVYICDPDNTDYPEIKQFYDNYYELLDTVQNDSDSFHYATLNIKSAYVNQETHAFIPCEADVQLEVYSDSSWTEPLVETKTIDAGHISISMHHADFELLDVHPASEHIYPTVMLSNLYGTAQESFDANVSRVNGWLIDGGSTSRGWRGNLTEYDCQMQMPVYVNGEQCTLNLYYHFIAKGTIVETYYRIPIIVFGVVAVLLALLWAWQKNVRNKARYAFEDDQRNLTDHLAHDIKTPLMAISGYAENILNGKLTEAEQTEYLNAIMENVSFTDSLISRTLYLNHADEKSRTEEMIRLQDAISEIIAKYTLMLKQKEIRYSTSGNAGIQADRNAVEMILENLIANAVKYTPERGKIEIAISPKSLTVTNTVDKKVDTDELKRPFVRGDAARSNADGNGLGLAIAERAALANGCTLSVSCTEKAFKAELKFPKASDDKKRKSDEKRS